MARIAFSFSNSMGSVPWGSDPGISEKHGVVGNLASFAIANRKLTIRNRIAKVAKIGRRARLRISKSSISKLFFSFQKRSDLRWENAIFHDQRHVFQ
jgi:hypothetical protein